MKYLFAITFFLVFNSCKSQDREVTIMQVDTDLPVKVMFEKAYNKDSTLIRIMIPQKIKVINTYGSKINLDRFFHSRSGGRVYSYKYGYIDSIKDTLVSPPTNIELDKKQEEVFDLYVVLRAFSSNKESKKLKKEGDFAQYRFKDKREVYNFDKRNKMKDFIESKISDSLKGYIQIGFYNLSTGKAFAQNVPVKF
ncbi:hypothetical protein [uncultured Aquimarina sp.]|uniref:hypothetical protein n=1 Tax=uncultured Aquimarina sp. TaxID=575652 RepID=UPI00260B8057|nr:hypothetical protein [uncultured Aquimarina sp.]